MTFKIFIMNTVLGLFLLFSMLVLHEGTHYVIYQSYDCEIIEATLTYVSAICPTDRQDLPNSINEIVGYNIMPVLLLILFFILIRDRTSHPQSKK